MEKVSLPVRIFAVAVLLVGVAGLLFLRTAGGSPTDPIPVAAPKPSPTKVTPAKVTPAVKVPVKPVPKPAKAAKPAPAKTAPTSPGLNAVRKVTPTGFPTSVDQALARHEVVVVSLVVPGSRVDELAAGEARAGAVAGGAGYLALNVLNEGVARALLAKLGSIRDPSLLVLKQRGEIAFTLNGFADRETVAQAAANAAS
ncbi:MAG: hypothetical protein ACXWZY_02975 [Gaiellaceae bacterium]